ncbi:MAG: DUF4382 domain-containing protein [Anaeromyxobacteraceae bacterium]
MNTHLKTCTVAGITAALGLAVACGSSTNTQQVVKPPLGQGQLAVTLASTQSAAPISGAHGTEVKEIWVTVTSVRAHSVGTGWVTISDATKMPFQLDLMTLKGASLPLGLVDLPPGTITQVRLLVEKDTNHVVLPDGTSVALKVPSGYESGIKIHGPWEIAACSRASVTLDFDGKKSIQVHPTGTGDEWILRPVIRVKATANDDVGCGAPDAGTDGGTDGGDDGTVVPLPPVPTGGTCAQNGECYSGVCSATFVCAAGANGAPCHAASDCQSAACGGDGVCTPPATAVGAGAGCTADSGCLSGVCSGTDGAKTCAAGEQGAPCAVALDCASGSCSEGTDTSGNHFCEPPPAL